MTNKVKHLMVTYDNNAYIGLYLNFSNYCRALCVEKYGFDSDSLMNSIINEQLEKYNAYFNYPFMVFGSEADKLEFQMVFG